MLPSVLLLALLTGTEQGAGPSFPAPRSYQAFVISTPREAPDPDLVEVARIGLAAAERPGHPLAVVVPDALPYVARHALASLRHVISRSQVPRSATYSQLPGYFYLERLEVSGSHAAFAGHSGAVPAVPPGIVQDACGSGPALTLERSGAGWVVVLWGSMAC